MYHLLTVEIIAAANTVNAHHKASFISAAVFRNIKPFKKQKAFFSNSQCILAITICNIIISFLLTINNILRFTYFDAV